jgi:pimeloyl-ACP methyl ester carboxylesterase
VKHSNIPSISHHQSQPGSSSHGALWIGAALALGAAALYHRMRSRRAERKHIAAGQFVVVDGVRLHYVDRGSGQAVVLLHDSGSMSDDFIVSGVVDMIARHYRVIVFDRPGFGLSMRPRNAFWTPQAQALLLRHAFEKIGVSKPIVYGHGWGASVAVALGLDYPDDIKSLVLASGTYYPTVGPRNVLFSLAGVPLIGDLISTTVAPFIARAMWRMNKNRRFGPRWAPEHFDYEFPVEMSLRPTQIHADAMEAALLPLVNMRMQTRYHELLLPIVILAGDSDRCVDTRHQSARLREALPHANLRIARGVGHMLHHAVQDQVMAAIDEAATAADAVQSYVLLNAPMLSQLKH